MIFRPLSFALVASLFVLGCGKKGHEVEDKLKAEAPKLCDAYCGEFSCGYGCRHSDGVEQAKTNIISHCKDIGALGTPITQVADATNGGRWVFDLKTCAFKP